MTRFLFSGQDILAPEPGRGEEASLPLGFAEPPPGAREAASLSRRFGLEGEDCEALLLPEGAHLPGARRLGLRQALAEYGVPESRAAVKGAALLRWLEVARHCGACGAELADVPAGDPHEGGRSCPDCGRVFFPRISPAVIVLVRKGPRILLAHNARFPSGRFGLIAGFVDAGETLEEAVERELAEEAGLRVDAPRYLKSQPWPFPDSLMAAFVADWASGEARPDGREIDELRWCLPAELPEIPPRGSVARWLIDAFASGELAG